jgi:hypothetical protein
MSHFSAISWREQVTFNEIMTGMSIDFEVAGEN